MNCARDVRHIRRLFFRSLVVASAYLVHETVCCCLETWHAPRLKKSHVSISSRKIKQKKTEEDLRMVQKKHDLWNIRMKEMKREDSRAPGDTRRVRKELGLERPTSSESCRSSMVDYDEEIALEPPRKRPEWLDWEEARGRAEDAWRLEPEGITEVPETVIVADEVEGHHRRGKVRKPQKSKWRARRRG